MSANLLTTGRIALAGAIAWLGVTGPYWDLAYLAALVLFIAGVASDVVDGWIARRRGPTLLGTILDPVADALLILGALLPFALRIPELTLVFVIVFIRDAFVLELRIRLARRHVALPAVPASKAKTAFLDVGCAMLFVAVMTNYSMLLAIAYASLAVGAFLSLTSALRYFAQARASHA